MNRLASSLGLLAIWPLIVAGQQPPPQEQAPTFRSEVNLVLAPVIVRDGSGRVVTTLQRKDFEVLDRGKPRPVVRFSLEAGTPPAPAPTGKAAGAETARSATVAQRFIALLFDDANAAPEDVLRARAAAASALDAMLPTDRIAVYTTTNAAQLDFTADLPLVRATIGKIAGRHALPATAPEVSYYLANQIVNRGDRSALEVVKRAVSLLKPGTPPQILETIATNTARAALADGEMRTRQTLSLFSGVIRRMSALPGQKALLLISPGFVTPQQQLEKNRLIDRATRSGILIHALDTRGVYTDQTFSAERASLDRDAMAYDREAALVQADILAELAEGTGGRFVRNTNDLRAGLVQLAAPPEAYYLIGFAPEEGDLDGRFHELKIRLPGKRGLTLTARRGYVAAKSGEPPPDPVREMSRELLLSRQETAAPEFQWSVAAKQSVRVDLRVRLSGVRFRQEQAHGVATLWVTAGHFDGNGALLGDETKRVDLKLPVESLAAAAGQHIEVTIELDSKPGMTHVRGAVWDHEQRVLSAVTFPVSNL